MIACQACGAENPDRARFCMDCGTRLGSPADDVATSRRTVTVLFADIVASSELARRLDPETLREVLSEYFAAMRTAIERHGGVVEKFIGDAVMAVFGYGTIHEDDAMRAVRAAQAMGDALTELNRSLRPRMKVEIRMRIGINTGEVVAGAAELDQSMVTGDTVNAAARLQQAAPVGGVLLGMDTWRMVRRAVTVEDVRAIRVKGRLEPLDAVRLVSINPTTDGAPGFATPLVGRDAELAQLLNAFEGVARDRVPALVSVVGSAGAGKSRLTSEFLARVGDRAAIAIGHCLSYGEGITYWPVREVIFALAGIHDRDSPRVALGRLRRFLRDEPDGSPVAARIASAVGLSANSFTQEEIFWAIRRMLEFVARDRGLVVVIEDVHWAEPTLVELLASIAIDASSVPLLLVCLTRTEVLGQESDALRRAGRASTIVLDALDDSAMDRLIASLPGASSISSELRARILAAVEGNPLFLEEMVSMVAEQGTPMTVLPATINALLAARVDTLPVAERATARRASVVGRAFEQSAVIALSPDEARRRITEDLLGLVRREIVSTQHSELSIADAYRFRHILLRDAAYQGLPKRERAELHERFADWLESSAGRRLAEYREIVGYHLLEAHRYRVELQDNDALTAALGARAAAHLAASGRAASDRGDVTAAIRLIDQALSLPEVEPAARAELLIDQGDAFLAAGRIAEIRAPIDAAFATATAIGDRRLLARSRLIRLRALTADGTLQSADPAVGDEAAEALRDAESCGDAVAIAEAESELGIDAWRLGDVEATRLHLTRALQHAMAAGKVRLAFEIELNLLVDTFAGPTPASAVEEQGMDVAHRAAGYPTVRGDANSVVSVLRAMLGRFDAAHSILDDSIAAFTDLANGYSLCNARTYRAWIYRLAGDFPAAEAELRIAMEEAASMEDRQMQSFVSCRLAEILVALERYSEAADALTVAERDPIGATRSRIIGARARIAAALDPNGSGDAVNALIAMVEAWASPWLNVQAEALRDAAFTMRSLGRRPEARAYALAAAELCRQKENVAFQRQLESFAVE